MEPAKIRVWLDDTNVIFRRGMASCLVAAGFAVVGESVRLTPAPDPARLSVLVVELDRPGLTAAARLAAGRPVRLVGIAATGEPDLVQEAVKAGFSGLLIRASLTPDGLVATVRAVACGAGSFAPPVLARLLTDLAHSPGARAGRGILTRRELDVLRLLAEGSSTREIAGALCYSERTVKNIVHDTLSKLNCRTRTHAVAVMARQGVL